MFRLWLLLPLLGLLTALLYGDITHQGVVSDSLVRESTTIPAGIRHYNRLGAEKSPYLLQHKNNPVHWYAWGQEALDAAKRENKLIFLSVGYSTCYWCHVMEKECFEKQEVADVLNQHFVSIKVDREERPDLDRVYMEAVQRLRGRGGWPMSVFLTPDLKPFFGGTYFPRARFLAILDKLQKKWHDQPEQILKTAQQLTKALEREEKLARGKLPDESALKKAYLQLWDRFDPEYGGFGRAPKFPPSLRLGLLLRIYHRTNTKEVLQMVTHTLDQMAAGGMYDHLGGGFHRYSTDKQWHVPHFEKMLYDNALLATVYMEAFQVTGKPRYARIARETLDYILRDMTDPLGGFYSAEDAGEVDREGEFYVWREAELKKLLTAQELQQLKKTYAVSAKGNFEHGHNILYLKHEAELPDKLPPLLQSARTKLFKARQQRKRPHRDDKVLTAWNGLMIGAMSRGFQVLGDIRYLTAAQKSAQFIRKTLTRKGQLLRRYRDGDARFPAYLNDYAFLIQGLLDLYESDAKQEWLKWAMDLQARQDRLFRDKKDGVYFFSDAKDPSVLIRQKPLQDSAIPSANGVTALNLVRLYGQTIDKDYRNKADALFEALNRKLKRAPAWFSQTLIALDFRLDRSKEIAIIRGESANDTTLKEFQTYLQTTFLPNRVISMGTEDNSDFPTILRNKKALNNKTTFYVCEENLCKLPTSDLQTARGFIEDNKPYSL